MRRVLLLPALVLGLATGLSVGPTPVGPAAASCAAPTLELDRAQRPLPRTGLLVTGRGFADCQDALGCTDAGCSTRCEPAEPARDPQQDVRLRLRQGERSWTLGVEDATEGGAVTWRVDLPDDVRPGRVRLAVPEAGPDATLVRRVSRS